MKEPKYDSEFEDWAIEQMNREGLAPDEFCNVHSYNWDDIMKEPSDDD